MWYDQSCGLGFSVWQQWTYRMGQLREIKAAWVMNQHDGIKMQVRKEKGRLVHAGQASIDRVFISWWGKGKGRRGIHGSMDIDLNNWKY